MGRRSAPPFVIVASINTSQRRSREVEWNVANNVNSGDLKAKEDIPFEEPLSENEREQIIQYLISTQMLAGVEVSYDEAAAAVDQVYSEPFPKIDGI